MPDASIGAGATLDPFRQEGATCVLTTTVNLGAAFEWADED